MAKKKSTKKAPAKKAAGRFEIYIRDDGKFAWRLVATSNGKIVATDGGQGFNSKFNANRSIVSFRNLVLAAPVNGLED